MQVTRQILSDTSPSSATTAAGTTMAGGLADCDTLTIIAALVGATGGTLDVYIQTSHDDGTTWYDWAHFTQLTAGAAASKVVLHTDRAVVAAPTTIGTGTTPALAANTVTGGSWGDKMRLLFTSGAGTSAGAAISVQVIAGKSN